MAGCLYNVVADNLESQRSSWLCKKFLLQLHQLSFISEATGRKYQFHGKWQMDIGCNRYLLHPTILSHYKYDIDEELNLSSDCL